MTRLVCLVLIFLVAGSSVRAEQSQANSLANNPGECFRVPRPALSSNVRANARADVRADVRANALADVGADVSQTPVFSETTNRQKLLGDVIYAGMRTPMPRNAFERWRQNYCCPFVCNMVLCHGTCFDFAEHCPSFSESGRVIPLGSLNCMEADNQAANQPASSVSPVRDCCD